MPLKSTDGKVEMTITAGTDKLFLGGVKAVVDALGEVEASEMSVSKAEVDTILGNNITVISLQNGKSIEANVMKGD